MQQRFIHTLKIQVFQVGTLQHRFHKTDAVFELFESQNQNLNALKIEKSREIVQTQATPFKQNF